MLRIKKMKLLNGKTINLDISPSEIVEISGANGTGKSLFLKSVARLISSSFEEFEFNNQSVSFFSPEEWRRNIMYLPPEITFNPEYSLEDFLSEPLDFEIYKNFSTSFNPQDHLGHLSGKMNLLSSGQKQQIALLRALMLEPKILLLDEPFAQMDLETRNRINVILKNWCSLDRAIIFVSHVPVDLNHKKIIF